MSLLPEKGIKLMILPSGGLLSIITRKRKKMSITSKLPLNLKKKRKI